MARTARFEMRLSPEKLERIDDARGDVLRTTWVETAIDMRLRGVPTPVSDLAGDVEEVATPTRAKAPSREQEAIEDDVTPASEPSAEAERPFYPPRRPPPRMTGGRKTR